MNHEKALTGKKLEAQQSSTAECHGDGICFLSESPETCWFYGFDNHIQMLSWLLRAGADAGHEQGRAMALSFYSMEIVFLVIANDSALISFLSPMHGIAPSGQLAASSLALINIFYESSSKALIIDRKYYLKDSTRRAVDLHWRLSFYWFLLTDNSLKSSGPLSIGRLLFWKFSIRRSSRKYYENNFSFIGPEWAWTTAENTFFVQQQPPGTARSISARIIICITILFMFMSRAKREMI